MVMKKMMMMMMINYATLNNPIKHNLKQGADNFHPSERRRFLVARLNSFLTSFHINELHRWKIPEETFAASRLVEIRV